MSSANPTLNEGDISQGVCKSCGECCRILVPLPMTTTRYRQFMRVAGYSVLPAAKPGARDCCDKQHPATLDLGYCRHLTVAPQTDSRAQFSCGIYETEQFPELCLQFNCVSWAKAHDRYSSKNRMLLRAQAAFDAQAATERSTP